MARDQKPVSEEELAIATERLEELRERVREDLAADLGGNPENYNANTYQVNEPVADGVGE